MDILNHYLNLTYQFAQAMTAEAARYGAIDSAITGIVLLIFTIICWRESTAYWNTIGSTTCKSEDEMCFVYSLLLALIASGGLVSVLCCVDQFCMALNAPHWYALKWAVKL